MQSFIQMLLIFFNHFCVNNVQVSNGVHVSFIMDDGLIVKCSNNVIHSIDSSDVGQESISKAFAFGSATDKPSDVSDVKLGFNF